MKHCLPFLAVIILLSIAPPATSQNLEDAGNYMTVMSNAQVEMNKKYMQYVSKSAHGAGMRKLEKMREQVLESITNSRYKVADMPYYQKNNDLRKACIDYMQMCYSIFNEDYSKIVNLEEIAEQSFDEMQAVILLHEKTAEKLQEASKKMEDAYATFATKYNVNVVEQKNELGQKLEQAGNVNQYLNKIYLIFFKCNWQDRQLTKAIENKKINDIEQARNSLIKYAEEGLKNLDTTRPFKGDNSLVTTCKTVLNAYKTIGEKDVPKQTDYLLKEENFIKIKRSFETKGNGSSKEEVDNYNKSIKEINEAVNSSNGAINSSNKSRTQIINNWNEAYQRFSDSQMPFYR